MPFGTAEKLALHLDIMVFVPYLSAIAIKQFINMKIIKRNSGKSMSRGNSSYGEGGRSSGRGRSGGGSSYGGSRSSSGGRSGGGSSSWRGGNGERPETYKAICGDCGKDCVVPFRPSGSRPVLCSFCFRGSDSRDSRPNERSGGRSFERRSQDNDRKPSNPDLRREMAEVNKKLDTILELLTGAIDGDDEDFEDEEDDNEDVTDDEDFEDEEEEKSVETPDDNFVFGNI